MAKIDEMRRSGMAFAAESMGAGLDTPEARVAPVGQPAMPARLQGLVRVKNVATIPVTRSNPTPTSRARRSRNPGSTAWPNR